MTIGGEQHTVRAAATPQDAPLPVLEKFLYEYPGVQPLLEENDEAVRKIQEAAKATGEERRIQPYIHYTSLLTNYLEMEEYSGVVVAYDTTFRRAINSALDSRHGKPIVPGILPLVGTILDANLKATAEGSAENDTFKEWKKNLDALQIPSTPPTDGIEIQPDTSPKKTLILEEYSVNFKRRLMGNDVLRKLTLS